MRTPVVITGLVMMMGLALPASGQSPRLGPHDGAGLPGSDLERVKVGSVAPDFTLEALDGPRVSLSRYRGNANVILVFYRGHW